MCTDECLVTDMLRTNSTLDKVTLHNNKDITAAGWGALCEGHKANTGLTDLNLRECDLLNDQKTKLEWIRASLSITFDSDSDNDDSDDSDDEEEDSDEM